LKCRDYCRERRKFKKRREGKEKKKCLIGRRKWREIGG
jgi:hypothetical protein